MKPIERRVLAILLCGNILLWGDRCSPRAERSFDYESFQGQAREAFPGSGLVEAFFESNPLLPDEYLYLEGTTDNPWFSVYVSYYPGQGLMGTEPHDPRVCYQVAEFETLQEDVMELTFPELEEPLYLNRILLQQHSLPDADGIVHTSQRIAYYWRHVRGEMPTQSGGGLSTLLQLPSRMLSRRSDLVWVRLELLPKEKLDVLSDDLDEETVRRIYSMMQAAAACMR